VTPRATTDLDFKDVASLGAQDLAKLKDRLTLRFAKDEKLFLQAYPGLAAALEGSGGSARLVVSAADAPDAYIGMQRMTIGKTTAATPNAAGMKEAAKLVPAEEESESYTMALQYRIGAGEWQTVRLASGETVTVKGLKKKPKPPGN
jgi:hypothetical protein